MERTGKVVGRQAAVARRLIEFVDAYARRVYPAVLEQHDAGAVCSPLGVWLLLAACASAAEGDDRRALERSLGCPADQAAESLAAFMAAPPPALQAAMALWVRAADARQEVREWARGLPPALQTGLMPTQEEADAWARRTTDGLIERFPMRIDERTRIVLASALATKVSWSVPLEVVAAAEHLGQSSPWQGQVNRLLWDERPGLIGKLVHTRAAGLVAVHCAAAVEGVTVVSVSAEPGLSRALVLDAAHEVVALMRDRWPASIGCSLFDLPLGSGHSWQISEREIPTWTAGEQVELITGASLPAWRVEGQLDLKRSELFGSAAALNVLRDLIGPRPDDETEAGQAAVASFTRFGFEAAAITFFGVATSLQAEPPEIGVERSATLRFDHPYAAVAIAGTASAAAGDEQPDSSFTGLPLFTAWIDTPEEPEDDPEDD